MTTTRRPFQTLVFADRWTCNCAAGDVPTNGEHCAEPWTVAQRHADGHGEPHEVRLVGVKRRGRV